MATVSKIFANKRKRLQRKKEGKCPCCGYPKEDNGYYRCNKCMDAQRKTREKTKK